MAYNLTRNLFPSIDRRRFLAGSGSLVALSFSTVGVRAQETAFSIMTVGGSWGEAIRKIVAEPFAAEHGLQLNVDARPTGQQIAVLQANRDQPSVDAVEIAGARIGHSIALGLIDRIDPALAPNYNRVLPALRNEFWAPRTIAPWVLAYNTTLFSKEEVAERGWSILHDPKVKGRVAIPTFGWMGEMWLHSLNQVAGHDYGNTDYAVEFAAKIMKDNGGIVMNTADHGINLFSSGEIAAAPFWSGRTIELQRNGLPLDLAFAPGWNPAGFGFSAVAGVKRPDLSQKFIDLSLSDDAQLQFARQFSYSPTLVDIKIPDDMAATTVPAEAFKVAANLDYSEVIKFSDANLERWNSEIVG